ncbi:MAG: holo-ACP synthase [Gammaproteobacteria bacterium]|nr:MAG: holo-ACP synthase [Gammaproteobacteria bacterium]
MVFGVGTDIVQISRIEMTWQRFGERFANRLLLDEERELFDTSKHPVRFLSMRFAVKEAVVKAMGTGFAHGMWVRDVGMVPNNWGQPQIIYSARGRRMCERLGIGRGHVSVTDEAGLIVAVAVLMNADSLGN